MNIDSYTSINQSVLKFVGLYPINIMRYIICISFIVLIIIPLIAQIYNDWGNLSIILETRFGLLWMCLKTKCSVLLTISLGVLKSLIWIFKGKDLEFLVNFMFVDYWRTVKVDVFNHLHVYAISAKNITKGYLFLICNALLFFFSLPFIEALIITIRDSGNNFTMKNFPFVAFYPSTFYNFPLYEIVYVSQMLATGTCGILILATDTLIATALLHTCGHYEVLKNNLKKLDSNIHHVNGLESNTKSINKNVYEVKSQVANIIKHHQVILWFCDNMEKNFNLMLFLQIMASSIIICFVGFQVSITLMEKSKLIKYFSHFMMALFQLLLFCFPGDILISQSSSISSVVYSIQWYELPTLIKNEVCLITLRSQKYSYITAGKMYIMHLENFSTVKKYLCKILLLLNLIIISNIHCVYTIADTQYCTFVLHAAAKLHRRSLELSNDIIII